MANVARQHEDVWLSVCYAGSCELCGKPYINSWLECIQFITIGQVCDQIKQGNTKSEMKEMIKFVCVYVELLYPSMYANRATHKITQ